MKKLFYIGMICLTALVIGALVCCTEKDGNDNTSGSNVVTNNDNGGDNGGNGGDNGGGNGGDNGGDNGGGNGGDSTNVNDVYVDLGLPSGTKWKNVNEVNAADTMYNLYSYDEAVEAFGNALPTKEQFQELVDSCQWLWEGNGYRVTGPNGNSIVFPAAGSHDCSGNVNHVGVGGNYWSSTPQGSSYAWDLGFNPNTKTVNSFYRCYGYTIRLVQH